jgi:hypothetical protein
MMPGLPVVVQDAPAATARLRPQRGPGRGLADRAGLIKRL